MWSPGVEVSEPEEAERVDPLEVGARGLRDLDRAACGLEAELVLELEGVQAGEANVGHRQLGRRPRLGEDVAGTLVLRPGGVGLGPLPEATAENDPVARRFERLVQTLERGDPLAQEALRGAGFPVQRAIVADPADQPGVLELVVDPGEHALQQSRRLAERGRAFSLVGASQAHRDGLLEPRRPEQMVRDVNRPAGLVGRKRVGGS